MASIALERADVIVGVDTHKNQHVAVALDGLGGRLGEPLLLDATNEGYAELLTWACALGRVHVFAVEGCGSYGIGLVQPRSRRHSATRATCSPRRLLPPKSGNMGSLV